MMAARFCVFIEIKNSPYSVQMLVDKINSALNVQQDEIVLPIYTYSLNCSPFSC